MACWDEYRAEPEVAARVKAHGPGAVTRMGSNDVFEINGVVARKIFEKNKKDHTFYLEQSVPITWMYPYLLPSGLIFKLNPEPLKEIPAAAVAEDHKFWDAYSQKLLSNPRFHLDSDATLVFGKLAFWHSDLYRYRHLEKEQEYWLKLSLAICPQTQESVSSLAYLYLDQERFDEAIALVTQGQLDDPRNDVYDTMLTMLKQAKVNAAREKELLGQLAKNPYGRLPQSRPGATIPGRGQVSRA